MSEGILIVTEQDYEEMKANGIKDETLLEPGEYKLRRRQGIPARHARNSTPSKVEFQMKLDLDVLEYFQQCAGNDTTESLQLVLNEQLRAAMNADIRIAEVEKRLLNDKRFIRALAEEVKKAA